MLVIFELVEQSILVVFFDFMVVSVVVLGWLVCVLILLLSEEEICDVVVGELDEGDVVLFLQLLDELQVWRKWWEVECWVVVVEKEQVVVE